MIAATVAFVAGALLAALSGVIVDEVRGWLELAPRGILRLVALRLPAGLRQAIYKEEWLPELVFILHEAAGGPLTRAARATWFAVSMVGAAAEIGRALSEGRNRAEAPVHIEPNLVIIQIGSDLDDAALGWEAPTKAAHLHIWLAPVY